MSAEAVKRRRTRCGGWDFVKAAEGSRGRAKHIGFSFHDTAEALEQHPPRLTRRWSLSSCRSTMWTGRARGVQSRKCYEVARKYGKSVIIMEPVRGGSLAIMPSPGAGGLQGGRAGDVRGLLGPAVRRLPGGRAHRAVRHVHRGAAERQRLLHGGLPAPGRGRAGHRAAGGGHPQQPAHHPLHRLQVLRGRMSPEDQHPRDLHAP